MSGDHKAIRILAVDDYALVRKVIRLMISPESDMDLIAEACITGVSVRSRQMELVAKIRF